ncbi:MAG: DUF4783 domain-containing protein [Bacteroidales bacterium]
MIFASVLFTSAAQDVDSAVKKGFSSGDVNLISKNMADKVFYVFYPERKSLTKDDATKKLDQFFKDKKPKDFSSTHDSRQDNVHYIIGKLTTTSGDYRVHLLFDTMNGNEVVTQIRIESL